MTTALIAEDEALLAAHLRAELAALWPELEIVAMASHGQEAVDAALARRPQICFLDIRMPGLSGLEAARAMAEDWPEGEAFPLLVFVTAYDQYALQAFEQSAVDYVLKPVQRERLAQTCERLRQQLQQRAAASAGAPVAALPLSEAQLQQLRQLLASPLAGSSSAAVAPAAAAAPLRVLQVGLGNTIQMVPVADVLFFEAADKYVRVVTRDKEHLVRISLRELLPQLDGSQFWQVHRGTVVRVEAIERAVRDEAGKLSLQLREHPERLGVSRLYAHLFKAL